MSDEMHDPKSVAFAEFARRSSERHGFAAYYYLVASYVTEFSDHFYSYSYERKSRKLYTLEEFTNQYNPSRFETFLQSMLLRLYVEDFLVYLKDVIAVIFRAEPRTLASKENISLDIVVKSNSIDEVLQYFASQSMSKISFFGFDDLRGEMQKRGVHLSMSKEEEQVIKEAIEKRNKIVHSGGYHTVVMGEDEKSEEFKVLHEEVRRLGDAIDSVVEKTDRDVCRKFQLYSKGLAVDSTGKVE